MELTKIYPDAGGSDIEITYSDESKYLLVTLHGSWCQKVMKDIIIEIREKLKGFGYKRALIDAWEFELPESSDFRRYQVGLIIAEEWGPYYKVTAVVKPENISNFVEDTAVNRGANFAVFPDMEAAKKWLLRGALK